MAVRNEKNRPLGVVVSVDQFNPQWDDEAGNFTSPLPTSRMTLVEIIDESDSELKPVPQQLTINYQQQIDTGMLTVEEVGQAMALKRKTFYNQIELNKTPVEGPEV